jgi:predicted transposase/invertase (TIGR01784 family)
MFDSICKFIAVQFSQDIATWLLGKPIALTELKPSELSLEPIRADSLIFLESDDIVLHIEFQTKPHEDIPFRMLDYRVRIYRHYPEKEVVQVVIYLRENNSKLTRQTVFQLSKTRHQFEVIRLWEVPVEALLESQGLLPFAILSQSQSRENTLKQISQKIEGIADRKQKSNLAASTAILAGLVLSKETIQRLLREEIMKESVIYQEIKAEGRAEGKQEGEATLAIRLLTRRIGQISTSLSTQIRSLSVEQLENLAEALLDFETEEDLRQWLTNNS